MDMKKVLGPGLGLLGLEPPVLGPLQPWPLEFIDIPDRKGGMCSLVLSDR